MIRDIPWSHTVTLVQAARGLPEQTLIASEADRKAIARYLDVVSVAELTAQVSTEPWLDGAELHGRFAARLTQTCSVSADDFEDTLTGDFMVRVVPRGSANAPQDESQGEVDLDPEADDPPDVAEGDTIDLAHYVIEHLALGLDPFPRKPGAVFEPPEEDKPASPFAVLLNLRPKDDE
ncbi:MAG: hypothetical protein JWP35_2366 [Caulobacter sp.]|nr:hypothetical protein [Caulobacter sp.]